MRHARVELWARQASAVHRLHPSAKIICTLAVLIAISTLQRHALAACAVYIFMLMASTRVARLSPLHLLGSAAAILPFAATFALISIIAGEPERAMLLVARSFTSSYAALLLVATTPMPSLIAGLEILRAPRFLLLVMQFLYRYLVVLFEEAAAIRDASTSRGGTLRTLQLQQAGAAAGVLFMRSYHRANSIHQAMLARGFEGRVPGLVQFRFTRIDLIFMVATVAMAVGVRLAAQ